MNARVKNLFRLYFDWIQLYKCLSWHFRTGVILHVVRFFGIRYFVADFMDYNIICDGFYELQHYLWLILWTTTLFVTDFMDYNTICDWFYELQHYLLLILWTTILCIKMFQWFIWFNGCSVSVQIIPSWTNKPLYKVL